MCIVELEVDVNVLGTILRSRLQSTTSVGCNGHDGFIHYHMGLLHCQRVVVESDKETAIVAIWTGHQFSCIGDANVIANKRGNNPI